MVGLSGIRLQHQGQCSHDCDTGGRHTTPTVHIIIGQSGSGKTTFVKGRFATRQDWTLATHYPATVSLQDGKAFIGKYGIGQRCEGTDALPYDSLPRILATLDLLATEMEGDLLLWTDIIVEGDRINNDRFFQHLLNKGYPSNLYLVEAPLEVSMGRLKATGSTIGEQFVRTTATKSLNNFNKYGTLMHGRRIRGA